MNFQSIVTRNAKHNYRPVDAGLYFKKWTDIISIANTIITCVENQGNFTKCYVEFSRILLDLNLTDYAVDFMETSRHFMQDKNENTQKELYNTIKKFSKDCNKFIDDEVNRLSSMK